MRTRGFILAVTIIAIGFLFFFAFIFVRHYAQEKKLAGRGEEHMIAEQAAIAGIDDAFLELKKDSKWVTGFDRALLPHSGATYSISFDRNQTRVPYSSNTKVTGTAVTGYGGRNVQSGYIHLISMGEYGGTSCCEEALISATGLDVALFGLGSIFLSGTVYTDSYNSDLGPYSQTVQMSGGDIATNSSAYRTVTVKNVTINGALRVGPGGSISQTLYIIGTPYWQSFQVSSELITVKVNPAPDLGPALGAISATTSTPTVLTPGTYTSLYAKSSTIELSPGDYVITGDVNMSSGGILNVRTGPVNLFVMGNIYSSSGASFANYSGKTKNFSIYGGNNAQTFDLKGLSGTNLGFRILAPNADLIFGGGNDFYGTFVAKTLSCSGNSNFHFDRAAMIIEGADAVPTKITARWLR